VPLDVIEVYKPSNARLLIQVPQISVQLFVIYDSPHVALEMSMVNGIESNQGVEQTPLRFHDAISEKIPL
jgi:hypothetical protein